MCALRQVMELHGEECPEVSGMPALLQKNFSFDAHILGFRWFQPMEATNCVGVKTLL